MIWSLVDARATVRNRDGNRCLICGHPVDEIHHRFRRGMGGSKAAEINSPANLMSLCAAHHRSAESLRTELSAPNGWCVPNLPAAFLTPVLTGYGWSLLLDGGTIAPLAPSYWFGDAEQARSWAHNNGLLPA